MDPRDVASTQRSYARGVTPREPQAQRVEPAPGELGAFGADYADAFSIGDAAGRTPRDWAEACLRAADAAGGAFGRLVWGGVLGFRLLDRRTPGTFVGWQVRTDDSDRYVLDSDGRLMAGRMVFASGSGVLTWTTMLKFHSRSGRRIWAVAGRAHRALAPRLLSRAATSSDRRPVR